MQPRAGTGFDSQSAEQQHTKTRATCTTTLVAGDVITASRTSRRFAKHEEKAKDESEFHPRVERHRWCNSPKRPPGRISIAAIHHSSTPRPVNTFDAGTSSIRFSQPATLNATSPRLSKTLTLQFGQSTTDRVSELSRSKAYHRPSSPLMRALFSRGSQILSHQTKPM